MRAERRPRWRPAGALSAAASWRVSLALAFHAGRLLPALGQTREHFGQQIDRDQEITSWGEVLAVGLAQLDDPAVNVRPVGRKLIFLGFRVELPRLDILDAGDAELSDRLGEVLVLETCIPIGGGGTHRWQPDPQQAGVR